MTILGRPRGFDRDAALQTAMLVFWRKGYSETSINDLCDAMGIRSPSLYAAFGSKESLYIESLEHYNKTVRPLVWGRLGDDAPVRDCMEQFLLAAASILPGYADAPRGCMATLAAIVDDSPGDLPEAIKSARLDGLDLLRLRLEAAVTEGELPRSTNVDRLSRFYLSVFQGMAIQARDGATQADLEGMAEAAMCAWPGD
jgi:AcrR family transcriptional regulator